VNDLWTLDATNLVLVSFGVGIVIGLTGMGGGALMTPALIFLGYPASAAVANDLVAAALNKSVGAAVHWRQGAPELRLACWLIAGSVPTAFAGAFIIDGIGATDDQEQFLKYAIGATLLLAAATYVLRSYLCLRADPRSELAARPLQVRPVPTMLLGAFGGLVVGITSVGSGSVIMVTLVLMYPMLTPVKLVGTDLVQAIPLVLSAAISHVIVSGVDWSILIPLIVGGSPGTYLGARISGSVGQSVIRRGISIVLFLTGLALLGASPVAMGLTGGGLLILGPVAWEGVRRTLGLAPTEGTSATE
jgi:uncharacterized membrane protein YfcA